MCTHMPSTVLYCPTCDCDTCWLTPTLTPFLLCSEPDKGGGGVGGVGELSQPVRVQPQLLLLQD